MAPVIQEPEVQFAQRLASNEKSVRTKAIKKLRKYLSIRSQKPEGGFTLDELLKIWKGLFYCLWMQDKPLQQEELSTQISGLIHWLQNVDTQFLFLESFLMTINREWNGIDRLRMDKFYSLVRFVLRETFEMMKRREWDTGLIGRFVELLSAQVLRSTSDAPKGVQFHILDIYMTELARVGSAQLTAEQNLTFIDPFCKSAAKTKDHVLVEAICSNIFREIVDQAPFAIEDLMRELQRADGRVSESDEEQDQEMEPDEETASKTVQKRPKKARGKRVNGVATTEDEDGDDEMEELVEEEEDDLPDLEEDSDVPQDDEDIGPVLQFDYQALAERLFELASRSNTPSFNRKKMYKLVKTFRNLSKGVFPQDEYPPEVSTDEDDDEMFGSRRKMRKRRRNGEDEPKAEPGEEGASAVKKRKVKKDAEKPTNSKQGSVTGPADSVTGPAGKPSDCAGAKKKKKKKRRKKKKTVSAEGENVPAEEVSEKPQTAQLDTGAEQASPSVAETTDCEVKSTQLAEFQNQSQMDTDSQNLSPTGTEGSVADVQAVGQSETLSTDGVSSKSTEKKRKRKKQKVPTRVTEVSDADAEGMNTDAAVPGEEESQSAPMEEEGAAPRQAETMPLPQGAKRKAKKKNKKMLEQIVESPAAAEEPTQPDTGSDCADAICADEQPSDGSSATQLKKGKRKKKVTVTQEDEAPGEKATHVNGQVVEEVAAPGKNAKQSSESEAISTPTAAKKSQKKKKAKVSSKVTSNFIKFQSPIVPTPLFCRQARGSPTTPVSKKQLSMTPSSESKKVTFGLKNNQTAEFKKTDRSLMVSPDGSSRVPFDPQQKPLFGVLKSPAAMKPQATNHKGRPTAADFF